MVYYLSNLENGTDYRQTYIRNENVVDCDVRKASSVQKHLYRVWRSKVCISKRTKMRVYT